MVWVIPAHARADVVAEVPEFRTSGDEGPDVVRVRDDGVRVVVLCAERRLQQSLAIRRAERRVRVVLTVKVEGHAIAVVANAAHGGLDLVHAAVRDRVIEDHPGIIAVVREHPVEQARERLAVGPDGAEFVVERAAAEQRDADADLFESGTG